MLTLQKQSCQFRKDGKNYGVPYDSNTVIACYRKDYLDQAGYTIDDLTDITWDRFIEIGKDVLDKTGMPMLTNVQGEPDLFKYDFTVCRNFRIR